MARFSILIAAAPPRLVSQGATCGSSDQGYDYASVKSRCRGSFLLESGDVVRVNVWNEPNHSRDAVLVRPDGKIPLPLVGDLSAAGLSVDQLNTAVRAKLQAFVPNPRVDISLVTARSYQIYVMGEVRNPARSARSRRSTCSRLSPWPAVSRRSPSATASPCSGTPTRASRAFLSTTTKCCAAKPPSRTCCSAGRHGRRALKKLSRAPRAARRRPHRPDRIVADGGLVREDDAGEAAAHQVVKVADLGARGLEVRGEVLEHLAGHQHRPAARRRGGARRRRRAGPAAPSWAPRSPRQIQSASTPASMRGQAPVASARSTLPTTMARGHPPAKPAGLGAVLHEGEGPGHGRATQRLEHAGVARGEVREPHRVLEEVQALAGQRPAGQTARRGCTESETALTRKRSRPSSQPSVSPSPTQEKSSGCGSGTSSPEAGSAAKRIVCPTLTARRAKGPSRILPPCRSTSRGAAEHRAHSATAARELRGVEVGGVEPEGGGARPGELDEAIEEAGPRVATSCLTAPAAASRGKKRIRARAAHWLRSRSFSSRHSAARADGEPHQSGCPLASTERMQMRVRADHVAIHEPVAAGAAALALEHPEGARWELGALANPGVVELVAAQRGADREEGVVRVDLGLDVAVALRPLRRARARPAARPPWRRRGRRTLRLRRGR